MTGDDSILGKRVKMTPKAIAAGLGKRGRRTGQVIGVRSNAGGVYLIILKDGTQHAQPYAVEFWCLDTEARTENA